MVETHLLATLGDPRIGDYLLQDKEGNLLKHSAAEVADVPLVGHGGESVVVRAQHASNRFIRALKILDQTVVSTEYYGDIPAAAFSPELVHHSTYHFKHTLPIVDCGIEDDAQGLRVIYYALPYVPGTQLEIYINELRTRTSYETLVRDARLRARLHDEVLLILRQVAEGLCEYESFGLIHMDVSPVNVMVRHETDGVGPECFLIDLGSARRLASINDDDPVSVWIKPWYFPLKQVRVVGPGQVSGADIRALGHRIDLYAFGRLLYTLFLDTKRLDEPPTTSTEGQEKERFWRTVLGPTGTFQFLQDLASRLLRLKVASPALLRDAIYPQALMNGGPFLWSGAFSPHLPGIRVRVRERLLHIPHPFSELTDHPSVQRLRRLHQLSLVDQIYPGATHTRFLHSLQVFDVARQYLLALSRSSEARLILTRQHTEEILAAALLHNIRQFPFSHGIEDLRKIQVVDGGGDAADERVLYDQEVAESVLTEEIAGAPSLWQLLTSAGLRPEIVAYILKKGPRDLKQDPVAQLGRDIVAGIIDADRVAYLMQDSDAAGVAFGRQVDISSLLEGLRIAWIDDIPRLAIDEKALSAVEAVLAAVYWMYRNVYWHHMNRGIMAAVKYTFQQLMRTKVFTFRDYLKTSASFTDMEAVKYLHGEFSKKFGETACSPLASIASFRRLGYKRIASVSHDSALSVDGILWLRLVRSYSSALETELLEALQNGLVVGKTLKPGEVLIDVPLKPRLLFLGVDANLTPSQETGSELGLRESRLWVIRGSGQEPIDIVKASKLVRELAWMEEVSSRRVRVFLADCHITPENRESLGAKAKRLLCQVLDDRDRRTTEPLPKNG
ncbi:MAG: hypothetical protein ABIQ65_12275 [Thermoanaerobaculia bacterium]